MVNVKALCEPKMNSYRVNVIMGTSSVLSSTTALTPRNRDLPDHWGPPWDMVMVAFLFIESVSVLRLELSFL